MLRDSASVLKYVWTHPANRHARGAAVVRAVIFQVRGRLGKSTLTTIGERTRMHAVLHRAASSKVVYGNPPDFPEMTAWRSILKEGDLFIDVGANVGTYSLWAADCGAEVIAMEPVPSTVALLRENVELNPSAQIEVMQVAVGSEAGVVKFASNFDSTNRVSDSGDIEVPMVKLDDVIGTRKVRGVKIDIEGFERPALEGALLALADHRIDFLQIEWNSLSSSMLGEDRGPLANVLLGLGYGLFRPDNDGRLVPANLNEEGDIFASRYESPGDGS